MVASLTLAFVALRTGLEMRRRRLSGVRGRGPLIARHVRFAQPAVLLIAVGFAGGILSAVYLRGWSPLEKLHSWLGVLAVGLFVITGWLGRRLMRGEGKVEIHGRLALLAALVSALTVLAGFVLLP
jgi:protein-S-isoprenylcysteine O-methyltransferase Ste14